MMDLPSRFLSARERAFACPDPAVWIHLATEAELEAEADRLRGRLASGENLPLAGLVFGVKDNIDVAGWPTTAACPAFSRTAEADAATVALLRAAGAVPLGKTNLDQFATGLVGTRSPYGRVQNPFSELHVSGGSSSGSAAAVARGHVDFALGTDTAGSGRIPAAFNDLFGFKPTPGSWSTRGVVPACRSLDCVSVFATGADLCRRVSELLARPDPGFAWSRGAPVTAPAGLPANFRFGIPRGGPPFLAEPLWIPLWERAVEALRSRGGTVVEIDFSPFEEAARLLYEGPWTAESWADLGSFVESHPAEVLPVTRSILESGRNPSAADGFRAAHGLRELRAAVDLEFRGIDFLVLPTAGRIPTIAEVETDPFGPNSFLGRGTNFCNLLDLCACAIPSGFDARGLPFGVTAFAPAFHDRVVLDAADRLSAAPPSDRVVLAVAGLHLKGEPLNHELVSRGGRLVRATRTSASYRCYRIVRGERRFPGLVRTGNGSPIEVELWSLPADGAGSFLASCVRPPLCLGTVELEDGSSAMGFLCEDWATPGMEDITRFGGWRAARGSP